MPVDCGSRSLQSFADCFFEQLLTYGTAVAEMVPDETGAVRYLYNAPQSDYLLRRAKDDFSTVEILRNDGVSGAPLPQQENLLYVALNAPPGSLYGTSVLHGLPFVSSVLMKIFNAVGQNWERVGNVRFAVTYKPAEDAGSRAYAKDRAMQIAEQWSEAMRSRDVRDFVAVGDVDIKVIGADNQILDSDVPVRQMLEQIVAKLGLPPVHAGAFVVHDRAYGVRTGGHPHHGDRILPPRAHAGASEDLPRASARLRLHGPRGDRLG